MRVKLPKLSLVLAASFLLLAAITLNTVGCTPQVQAADIMKGLVSEKVEGKASDDKFLKNTADFSLDLFKSTISPEDNSLISPLSVLLALAMTANGADTATLVEMEAVLGGDIPLAQLNEYLYTYVGSLPSAKKAKLSIANSIWFREDEDRLMVEQDFLQTNADYYGAAAYKAAFDKQTLADINNWVENNTDGMIDKILDEIAEDAVMYLINAIVFDAEWKDIYNKDNVRQGEFTAIDGSKQQADFMSSEEAHYLDDGRATGFIKPYADGNYSFAALLPNEGINVQDYVTCLSGEGLLRAIEEAQEITVNATMPKFSYDYTVNMNDSLKDMGMPTAFSAAAADFSKLGRSTRGNIYLYEVLHKTFIAVDERGTRAGAVTKVEMRDEAYFETKIVRLDRPFVYAIIDNATNLPIFIGTVVNLD